ncbi:MULTISPECIES: DnaD domain protein [unclassified Granulicatella]|uniref:DnaD domain protein n=1 Tax=unclassified Granulicatella TaxID=2630493 RepID=UPI00107370A4|nr:MULTISPECIES: DnaD domain protein [unclassified Granulicatella]MBF0779685.1 DnaD domain protein [Granulicatella sp. 19428wC4_WM01]TFU96339.1 hypothetical protein E4T68_01135 [Granulicatella sp. WM01]
MLEWKDINMQDYVMIQHLNTITDVDRDVVFTLYQPMIGAKAAALYQFLVSQSKNRIRLTHQSMLFMLQYNVQEFFQSRARLEAMGLLITYRTDDDTLDRYIYDVQAPVSPYDFFNDPVYCGLLCEQIGQEHFNRLRAKFIVHPVSLKDYTNISQSFGKVFGQHITLQTNDAHIIGQQKAQLAIDNEDFDWEFFSRLILGTYVTQEQITVQVKQAILTIHQLYHTSPMDMREYILQAHSLADNTINVDKLYAIARQYKTNYHDNPRVKQTIDVQEQDVKKYPEEIQVLIKQCVQFAPAEFVRQIKTQKNKQQINGLQFQVEELELKVLELLIKEFQFKDSVVNMMSYYILVVLNHAALTQAYVKRVANDWVKHNIATPEQAIDYLKKRVETREERQKPKTRQKNVKQIKLTEREKQALQDIDIPVDEEDWQGVFS